MASSTSIGLKPTLAKCICLTTMDGLLIFELALRGQLDPIRRRPHDRERAELVQSGNVFLFNDVDSGIKRWTDGITWSPSRIMGNYLIYRELAQPFPPGEKKKAQKRVSKSRRSNTSSQSPQSAETNNGLNSPISAGDTDRNLVGSLVDSYGFKSNGLVKKTLSIKMEDGRLFHLISYYRPDDVYTLQRPDAMPMFQGINVRALLLDHHRQGFRVLHEPNPPDYTQQNPYIHNGSSMSTPTSSESGAKFGILPEPDNSTSTSPVIDPRFGNQPYTRSKLELSHHDNAIPNQYDGGYNTVAHYAPTTDSGYGSHVSNFPRFPEDSLHQTHFDGFHESQMIGNQARYRPPLSHESTSPTSQRIQHPSIMDGEHAQMHPTWSSSMSHPHTAAPHASIPAYAAQANYSQMTLRLPNPTFGGAYQDGVDVGPWSNEPPMINDSETSDNPDLGQHPDGRPYSSSNTRPNPPGEYWRDRLN